MSTIVFDIETVGQDFELLDKTAQESFLKFAKTPEEIEQARESLNFYPPTAQIVAIGMLEAETERGVVYFQNGQGQKEEFSQDGITFVSGTEYEILQCFWKEIKKHSSFVTFNGRTFDCPFIMLRSAINKMRAQKNLMPYRFAMDVHIDLADQLSYYDALRRKFSLHMWCQAFGIQSPKEEGITGADVKGLYKKGCYHEIAAYCMRDIHATKRLYEYWKNLLKF